MAAAARDRRGPEARRVLRVRPAGRARPLRRARVAQARPLDVLRDEPLAGQAREEAGRAGPIVDIGAELYAISAAAVYAQTLREEHPERGDEAVELADLFIQQARRRVDALFGELFSNDDDANYELAHQVLEGRYTWLEEGIVDPSGDGPMIAEQPPEVSRTRRSGNPTRKGLRERQGVHRICPGPAVRTLRSAVGGKTVDWLAMERSPEFQELVHERRKIIVPATIVFLVGALGYLLLAAFVPSVMGWQIVDGLPFAWVAAISQVLLT